MMQRDHWYLTEGLIFAHFAIFILSRSVPDATQALMVLPGTVASQPWRLLTFQFIHGGMIWFFVSMLVLWIMARPLEEEWGSPRFLVFWLISVLGASGTATLLHLPLYGDIFLQTSLLFTFATLFPDRQFYLYFILPVKVKWLAWIGGGLLLLSSFQLGILKGAANIVGMSAGYVFFLATRNLPSRRKLAFELKKRKNEAIGSSESAKVEQRNQAWDDQVRAAEARARDQGRVAEQDQELLTVLDNAVDPSITVCAPEDFQYTDDPVCRSCEGYAECAARRIRIAAAEAGDGDQGSSGDQGDSGDQDR